MVHRDGEDPPDPGLPPGQHQVDPAPVMHYGRIPERDPARWTFTIGGGTASRRESVFTWDDLQAMERVSMTADMHCATNWSARGLHWEGVRARDVVGLAPPADPVQMALVFAEFGYAANVAVADLVHPDALLATHLDGAPLTAERGAPMRLVIPHLYTWKGPKWVRGWNYLFPEDPDRGFWEQRGYHPRGRAWPQERYVARP